MGVAVVGLAYGGYVLWQWMSKRKVADDTNPKRKRGPSDAPPHWRFGLACGGVLLVAALVAAPWYLAVESQNPDFLRHYFLDRHLLGLASDTQPHSDQPWWYYLPVLLGGGLPWIGYLPVLGIRGRGKGDRSNLPERPEGCFAQIGPVAFSARNPKSEIRNPFSPVPLLWCWLIGWTAFLTLAQTKLATYLWPAFPPLAILAAIVWAKVIADEGSGVRGQGLGQTPAGMNREPRTLNPFPSLNDAARRSLRERSSGRLGVGRSCCRLWCWWCSWSTRCVFRGRSGWRSVWWRQFLRCRSFRGVRAGGRLAWRPRYSLWLHNSWWL